MGCWSNQDRWQNKMERMQYKMERMRDRMERRGFGGFGFRPAFQREPRLRRRQYRTAETLRRLEGEAGRVQELPRSPAPRQGREEFDQFMAQHKPRRLRRTTSRSRAEFGRVFKRSAYQKFA